MNILIQILLVIVVSTAWIWGIIKIADWLWLKQANNIANKYHKKK